MGLIENLNHYIPNLKKIIDKLMKSHNDYIVSASMRNYYEDLKGVLYIIVLVTVNSHNFE